MRISLKLNLRWRLICRFNKLLIRRRQRSVCHLHAQHMTSRGQLPRTWIKSSLRLIIFWDWVKLMIPRLSTPIPKFQNPNLSCTRVDLIQIFQNRKNSILKTDKMIYRKMLFILNRKRFSSLDLDSRKLREAWLKKVLMCPRDNTFFHSL